MENQPLPQIEVKELKPVHEVIAEARQCLALLEEEAIQLLVLGRNEAAESVNYEEFTKPKR